MCGDGDKAAEEACDDGGTDVLDGCDASCEIEDGWSCVGTTPSVCSEICGDDMMVGDEECDDDNTDNGDGCRDDCTVEACGDGIVDPNMLCFHPPVSYETPGPGLVPNVEDLDGDANLDLVVSGVSGIARPVSVLLATAPGVFAAATQVAPSGETLVLGQSNVGTDTFIDITFATGAFVINTRQNTGSGLFGAAIVDESPMAYPKFAMADLDGDGNDDLFVTGCDDVGCITGTLKVYLADGSGAFAAPTSYASAPSNATLVADANGDGELDVLVLNYGGGTVGFFEGNGDGTFGDQVTSPVPDFNYLNSLELGDTDGTGGLDIVVGSQALQKPIYVLKGVGDGTFENPVALATAGANTFSTKFADVDNDGHLDVISGTQNERILFYKGDGAGNFAATIDLFTPAAGDIWLVTADLNDDGALDVVATDPGVGVNVYLSNP